MQYNFAPHSTFYAENQLLVCDENNKVFYLETMDASFAKIKIDGGVEQNTTNPKCDYIIIKQVAENIEIFVELKGKNIQDAYEQIIASHNRYANTNQNVKHYAAIVTSFITPKTRVKLATIKSELKKKRLKPLIKNKVLKVKYNSNADSIEKIN